MATVERVRVMFPYTFEVGEVAIVIDPGQIYDGVECLVTEPLQFVHCQSINPPYWYDKGMMYGTRIEGVERIMWAFPFELRKKRPPADDVQELRECETETA